MLLLPFFFDKVFDKISSTALQTKPQINFKIQSFALIYSIELIKLEIDAEASVSTH